MLDSILDSVKGQVVSTLAEKAGIDAGQAEQAVPMAQESITEGLMGAVTGGNMEGILGMLQGATGGDGGGLLNNMVFKGIAGNFIGKLTGQLGLSEGVAGTVSSMALPMIMSKLGGAAQAHGDTDGIDESSVLGALGLDSGSLLGGLAGSGAAGDLLGKASSMLGGKDEEDGGGIAGKIGGFFK